MQRYGSQKIGPPEYVLDSSSTLEPVLTDLVDSGDSISATSVSCNMPGPDPNDEVRAPTIFKLRSNLTSIFTQEPIGVPFPGVTSCEPGLPNWVPLLPCSLL